MASLPVERAPPANAGRLQWATSGRLLVLVVGLGLVARLARYVLDFPLWGDEAFIAVDLLARGWRELFEPLSYRQIVPPAFMATEWLAARMLGVDEWALRLPSVVCSVAGLVLFAWFVRRNLGRRAAVLAVGFLAAAYYPIRHGVELKPYAQDLLISLLLTCQTWAVVRNPTRRRHWIVLSALSAVAVWCSYPAAFVAGGAFLTLGVVVVRSPRDRVRWLVLGVVLGLSWSAMYLFYGRPHAAAAGERLTDEWAASFPPLSEPARLPLWLVQTHAGNLLAYPVGGKNGGSTLTLLLVLVGCAALRRRRRWLLLLLLAPLPLNMLAAGMHRYPYGGTARVTLFMAPAFCLLAGVGAAAALRRFVAWRRRRDAFRIVAMVLAAIAAGSTVRDLLQPYKKRANFEARRVIRELAGQVRPGDSVVAFHALADAPGGPFIEPWGGDGAQFIFYLTRYLPVPVGWAAPPSDLPRARTWVLFFGGQEYHRRYDAYRRQRGDAYAAAHPPLAAQLEVYVAALRSRFGAETHRAFVLEREHGVAWQQIDAWCFEAPAGLPAPEGVGL